MSREGLRDSYGYAKNSDYDVGNKVHLILVPNETKRILFQLTIEKSSGEIPLEFVSNQSKSPEGPTVW